MAPNDEESTVGVCVIQFPWRDSSLRIKDIIVLFRWMQ